jgi:hypothetical protein
MQQKRRLWFLGAIYTMYTGTKLHKWAITMHTASIADRENAKDALLANDGYNHITAMNNS